MNKKLFPLVAILLVASMLLSACGSWSRDGQCLSGVGDWTGCVTSSEETNAWLTRNGYNLPTSTNAQQFPAAQQPVPYVAEPPVVPQSQPLSSSYPLAGQEYESPQGFSYNAIWTNDGRLWQPQLPTGAERIAHTVAITIEEGSYAFDGVECQLFVDSSRNGAGASNPVTAAFGNDLRFTVKTADGGQAWALVQCRGNASSGFQIRWLGK